MRSYEIDPRLKRVVGYIEYSVVESDSPFLVECVKGKSCENRLVYDENGNLTRFVMGSTGGVWRGDFVELKTGELIRDELMSPEAFHGNNSPFVLDDSIKDAIALLVSLGISSESKNEARK